MAGKTIDDRIGSLDDKIKQLEAQKKQLEARSKEKARKERTRRLIQLGAIMDSMGIDTVEIADLFKQKVLNSEGIMSWIKETKNNKEDSMN